MTLTKLIRSTGIAAVGLLAILAGKVGAVLPPDAVEGLKANAQTVLEVKVIEAQSAADTGERFVVVYRMEVVSVLRSTMRVEPGEIIRVRSYGVSQALLDRGFVGPKIPALLVPGWIGTAYLDSDPQASGADVERQFVIAAHGDSFVELPPGPPALQYSVMPPEGEQ
ncbi:hypothetical protein [Thiocapsa roseopersicina]|uniref:Uncharacterized protein n=1 Tax=Thiocapsa roseopersicina TaxID=1058 RepID=A0A1H3D7Z2_THIRO|nr:hypothetical protein [Thiocapsa roseopersicina]SDX62642.1 hypothetical protein SAMN05421783_1448 [Thiocapsa roseopersicina]